MTTNLALSYAQPKLGTFSAPKATYLMTSFNEASVMNTARNESHRAFPQTVEGELGLDLLDALNAQRIKRNETKNEMSKDIGVTYGYINQLTNGHRKVSQISDEFSRSCAKYLGVSRLIVLVLAGRIELSEVEALIQAIDAPPNQLREFIESYMASVNNTLLFSTQACSRNRPARAKPQSLLKGL